MSGDFTHCMVKRCPRIGWSFFHHFIILQIDERKMTVAHYTDTFPVLAGIANSVGEFVVDTFTLERNNTNKPCDLLDFSKGVYIVTPNGKRVRRSHNDAIFRLLQRMNESKYNVTTNNCEHVVNEILYEAHLDNQADLTCCRSNIVGGIVNNIKNMGVKIVLLIPFLGALFGSLGRCSHVKILASAFYFYTTNEGVDECVLSNLGQNTMNNIRKEILGMKDVLEDVLKKHNYTFNGNVTSSLSEMLTNPLVCEAANFLSNNDASYILQLSIMVPLVIEMYLSLNVCVHYLGTLLGKILNKVITREYVVQFFAWVFANGTIGVLGYVTLTHGKSHPFIWFCVLYVLLGVVSRFLFTMVFGCILDKILAKYRLMIVQNKIKNGVTFWGVFFPTVCLALSIFVAITLSQGVLY